MAVRGPAIYLDGMSARRREVTVEVDGGRLVLSDESGAEIDTWPGGELRLLEIRNGVSRFVRERGGEPGPERLEVVDGNLVSAIGLAAERLRERPRLPRVVVARIAGLAVLAAASIIGFVTLGIPALADRLGPLVPPAVEARLGEAVEAQVRFMLAPRQGEFECNGAAGRAALDKMVGALVRDDRYAVRPRVGVARTTVPNAFALPGGQVYLLRGLIQRARDPDEVAGVLAHELGHVHHRHGMRRLLQVGATSFLIGLMIGDFTGSGVVAAVVQNLAAASYSREAEREADDFAVDVMIRAGADARGFGRLIDRIVPGGAGSRNYFDSHPWTPDRIAAIEARLAGREARGPILDAAEWDALRRICD